MRCIVKDCQNHEHEGLFVGSLCSPCHQYITKGQGRYSQAYLNAQRKPLTDEEIQSIESACIEPVDGKGWGFINRTQFVRAIEAAHGIKE